MPVERQWQPRIRHGSKQFSNTVTEGTVATCSGGDCYKKGSFHFLPLETRHGFQVERVVLERQTLFGCKVQLNYSKGIK